MTLNTCLITAAASAAVQHFDLTTGIDDKGTYVVITPENVGKVAQGLVHLLGANPMGVLHGGWVVGSQNIRHSLQSIGFMNKLVAELAESNVQPSWAFLLGSLMEKLYPLTDLKTTFTAIRLYVNSTPVVLFSTQYTAPLEDDPDYHTAIKRLCVCVLDAHHFRESPADMPTRIHVVTTVLSSLDRADIRFLRDYPQAFRALRHEEQQRIGARNPLYADIMSVIIHDAVFDAK